MGADEKVVCGRTEGPTTTITTFISIYIIILNTLYRTKKKEKCRPCTRAYKLVRSSLRAVHPPFGSARCESDVPGDSGWRQAVGNLEHRADQHAVPSCLHIASASLPRASLCLSRPGQGHPSQRQRVCQADSGGGMARARQMAGPPVCPVAAHDTLSSLLTCLETQAKNRGPQSQRVPGTQAHR